MASSKWLRTVFAWIAGLHIQILVVGDLLLFWWFSVVFPPVLLPTSVVAHGMIVVIAGLHQHSGRFNMFHRHLSIALVLISVVPSPPWRQPFWILLDEVSILSNHLHGIHSHSTPSIRSALSDFFQQGGCEFWSRPDFVVHLTLALLSVVGASKMHPAFRLRILVVPSPQIENDETRL